MFQAKIAVVAAKIERNKSWFNVLPAIAKMRGKSKNEKKESAIHVP